MLDQERYLEALAEEGGRLAAMPVDLLDAPVPAVEGWTLEKVVRHCTRVHWWVTGVLAGGPGVDLGAVSAELPRAPRGPECLPTYRRALDGLLAELGGHDPDEASNTFVGPGSVGFWARRQANEVTVHRVDAADAVRSAGGAAPAPIPPDLAFDGLEEWADVFLGTRWAQRFGAFPEGLVGCTVSLRATDDPLPPDGSGLLLAVRAEGVDVEVGQAPADVTLSGPAQELLLTMWRRRPLDAVAVAGDRGVAQRLLDVARF